MKQIVNNYISKNYNELRKIAFNLTHNHQLSEDLLHFCLLDILEKPEVKLRTCDDNSIKYYIIAVMRINFYSKTSPFYYQIRREFDKYQELPIFVEAIEEAQYNFEIDEMISAAEESFCSLDFFHKSLFELYLTLGSINKVSKKTTIPLTNISKYIKKIKSNMREEILAQIKQNSINHGQFKRRN
jgi:hypothetical protein